MEMGTRMLIVPVLMAGGSGTRLWPLSRAMYPKQFLSFDEGRDTLFQKSLRRLTALEKAQAAGTATAMGAPIILGNEEHRFLVIDQLRELHCQDAMLLIEPMGRNTAPALTLAALAAQQDGQDPVLIVSPADQVVKNEDRFHAALHEAVAEAAAGHVCTLGIVPDRPETGYGYIQVEQGAQSAPTARPVQAFVEKPDLATAQSYLEAGCYYWNAGIFILRASTWLELIRTYRADIAQAVTTAWERRTQDQPFCRPDAEAFAQVPSESIDYAVMEPLSRERQSVHRQLKVIPLDAGWSDLGAWDAVWKDSPKDAQGNACVGDVLLQQSGGNLVHASSRLVALVDVQDLVVVETPDAVLVASQDSSQDVKKIVNRLAASGREEQTLHRKVHRPWGWYDSIDEDQRFKVKRIQVKPGASLSLQKHHHRAEHWIVVSGTAEVTCGQKVILLTENQSIYIPLGEVHRLANPGKLPLEIIEVQSGSYLGEDDIVRYVDNYGRISDHVQ